MFEEEVMRLWKLSLMISSIYLLFGLVLTWNFIASGGFMAGPLPGHFITYWRPGSFHLPAFAFGHIRWGIIIKIWSNQDNLSKYDDDPTILLRVDYNRTSCGSSSSCNLPQFSF